MTRLSKDTAMLGRGVKRKRSCLGDEVLPDAARKVDKRRDEDGGEGGAAFGSDTSRLQQRQVVFGLCLKKLQDYRAGVELSLRRSVLLVNTLRQIQEEMQRDRTGSPDLHLCSVHPDSCIMRDSGTEDLSVTCPGCTAGDCEAPPFPDFLPGGSALGDATNTTGYLSDLALDDIFEDIDTSMYETSDLPSSCAAASLWPIAVSLWPEENAKLHPHSPGGGLPSCLMDLNELDHIIEILVKS